MSKYIDALRDRRASRQYDASKMLARGNLTKQENKQVADLLDEVEEIDTQIARAKNDHLDTRGDKSDPKRGKRNIEGRTGEQIRSGQFGTWLDRARENDVHITAGTKKSGYHDVPLRSQGTDRDLNQWWAERLGFAKPTLESRALLEDTAGSLQAATPQEWNANYIDVLLPQTILGRVGAVAVPMAQETMNIPVFSSTVVAVVDRRSWQHCPGCQPGILGTPAFCNWRI